MSKGALGQFCRLVRSRSQENQAAFRMLMEADLYATAIGLLRQELDSMIRVIYLVELDAAERLRLINDCVNGVEWRRQTPRGKSVRITDKEMVDIAVRTNGWVNLVYKFGSRLIHLSAFHDYKARDPIRLLDLQQQGEIRHYLEYYHGYPAAELTAVGVFQRLPAVMKKIASNLLSYVAELEKG